MQEMISIASNSNLWNAGAPAIAAVASYGLGLEKAGLVFSGTSPDGRLMEIAELPKKSHPFHLGTQFHPEFKSSPLHPHPLFREFIKNAIK